MSALTPEAPVTAAIPDSGDACQVQLLKVSGDGDVLMTTWFVAEAFIDVREKLTALLGAPGADGTMNMTSMLPEIMKVMSQPTTHLQIGGQVFSPPDTESGT